MQTRCASIAILLLVGVGLMMACAVDVSAKVVDGLGRPVANALIDIHWLKSVSEDDVRKVDLAKFLSDRDGLVKGTYDDGSKPKDRPLRFTCDGAMANNASEKKASSAEVL
jgi:hypothetical protein